MGKTLILLIILTSGVLNTNAQTNCIWANSAGGNFNSYSQSVSTDSSGNVIVAGNFAGYSITFGNIILFNASSLTDDIFIVKYDPNGNVLWAKRSGGTSSDKALSVSTDEKGNVFITGYFQSSAIIFGSDTLMNDTNNNSADIFIVKYDPNGIELWAKNAGGASSEYGMGVTTDSNGNSFVTGYFGSSTIVFGNNTVTKNGNSGYDIFIVKYDPYGNALWARMAGGTSSDFANAISTDSKNNVFITGSFQSPTIIFGTDTLVNDTTNSKDIFVVKYDSTGNVAWGKRAGGKSSDNARAVSTDASGNILITGYFDSSTISFGTDTLVNASPTHDVFIVKYDPDGAVLWANRAGGTNYDIGEGVATDNMGNVLVTGYFQSPSINFGIIALTKNTASSNIFIVKYNSYGTAMWANNIGGNGTAFDQGNGVCSDPSGHVIITGFFGNQTITFGTITLTNLLSPYADIFVVKFDNSVGIGEIAGNNANGYYSINAYPNPSSDEITLQSNLSNINRVKIFDVSGREIFSSKENDLQKINVREFENGIYFLKINREEKIFTKKIIVQH